MRFLSTPTIPKVRKLDEKVCSDIPYFPKQRGHVNAHYILQAGRTLCEDGHRRYQDRRNPRACKCDPMKRRRGFVRMSSMITDGRFRR